ncbi:MAG: type I restriction-modification system subunit M N-terminal domain-containing protein [Akkermansiaceae bacterium]|nr:type I restriction-modification system subunit M N-terminal domain-containing protein [Akkermansiaceae bacterium]
MWKGYILPLLFLKRISYVWDKEHARPIKRYGEDFEDEHRFLIPCGCHWEDVHSTAQSIGAALRHAMREVERVNPVSLYRVFVFGDWSIRRGSPMS